MGLSSEDNINVFSQDIVHLDDYSAQNIAVEKGIKSKAPFEMKRRLKGADGEYCWYVTRISPVLDFDDNVISLFGTSTDINHTVEAQEELQALPDSLKTCIWKITPRGDVVYVNKAFKDFVGSKEGDSLNVFSEKVCSQVDFTTSRLFTRKTSGTLLPSL